MTGQRDKRRLCDVSQGVPWGMGEPRDRGTAFVAGIVLERGLLSLRAEQTVLAHAKKDLL